MRRNYLHLTCYSYLQHGGLFDQMPLKAAEQLIPRKAGLPAAQYGGYNKAAAAGFALVQSVTTAKNKSKSELTFMPVDLPVASRFAADADFAAAYAKQILGIRDDGKTTISFPFGIKLVKIKTVIELDGVFRVRVNGKTGKNLSISIFTPLVLPNDWEKYVKCLESFRKKQEKNKKLVYSPIYDKFDKERNVALYDLIIKKLKEAPFLKHTRNPMTVLEERKNNFINLDETKQAMILLDTISALGPGSIAGIDLTGIGGVANAGITILSGNVSNWSKNYHSACLVFSDAAGLHEVKSRNLLELVSVSAPQKTKSAKKSADADPAADELPGL